MRTADRLRAGFGKAEVPDLALRDQVLDRAGDLFYRHVGIDSVLVEQVDRLDAEASEGGVGGLPDQLGPARKGRPAARVDLPELRGDDDLITNGRERVAHELLVRERAIGLRRVEERHAEVHRLPDQRNRLVPVQSGAAVVAQAHAAKPERRYLQPARPQHPLLQGVFHAFNRTTIHTWRGRRCASGAARRRRGFRATHRAATCRRAGPAARRTRGGPGQWRVTSESQPRPAGTGRRLELQQLLPDGYGVPVEPGHAQPLGNGCPGTPRASRSRAKHSVPERRALKSRRWCWWHQLTNWRRSSSHASGVRPL